MTAGTMPDQPLRQCLTIRAEQPEAHRTQGPQRYLLDEAGPSSAVATLDWDSALLRMLADHQDGRLDEQGARVLGDRLRALLLALGGESIEQRLAEALGTGLPVHLTIRSPQRPVLALPWELLHLQGHAYPHIHLDPHLKLRRRRLTPRTSAVMAIDGSDLAARKAALLDEALADLESEEVDVVEVEPLATLGDGRYQLIRLVSESDRARIWQAVTVRTDVPVAIKLASPAVSEDAERLDAFFGDARRQRNLAQDPATGDWVVPVVEVRCAEPGVHGFAMAWMAGGDLHSAVLEGRLTDDEALRTVLRVGEGLSRMHPKLPHGDIQPRHILLDETQEPRLTSPERGSATGRYAAPEVAAGGLPSPAADQYALAMTALFCLRGEELPDNLFVGGQHIIWSVRCPQEAKEVLLSGFAENPAHRFPDVAAFCDALRVACFPEETAEALVPLDTEGAPSEEWSAAPAAPAPPPAVAFTADAGVVAARTATADAEPSERTPPPGALPLHSLVELAASAEEPSTELIDLAPAAAPPLPVVPPSIAPQPPPPQPRRTRWELLLVIAALLAVLGAAAAVIEGDEPLPEPSEPPVAVVKPPPARPAVVVPQPEPTPPPEDSAAEPVVEELGEVVADAAQVVDAPQRTPPKVRPAVRAPTTTSGEVAPQRPVDTDGDGRVDAEDLCPTVPETAKVGITQDGCPDGSSTVRFSVFDAQGERITPDQLVVGGEAQRFGRRLRAPVDVARPEGPGSVSVSLPAAAALTFVVDAPGCGTLEVVERQLAPGAPGRLRVEVAGVEGESVALNGADQGGPVLGAEVAPGPKRVVVRAPGHRPLRFDVTVRPGWETARVYRMPAAGCPGR